MRELTSLQQRCRLARQDLVPRLDYGLHMAVEIIVGGLQSRVLVVPSLVDFRYLDLLVAISVRGGDGQERRQRPEGERCLRWVLRVVEHDHGL